MRAEFLFTLLVLLGCSSLFAAERMMSEDEAQPHIEKLKQKYGIRPKASSSETASPVEKKPNIVAPSSMGGNDQMEPHIDKIRREYGLEQKAEEQKAFSSDPHTVQPYIEKMKAQGGELEAKMKKKVDQAAGVLIMATKRFKVSSDKVQAVSFESVYKPDEKYTPSVDVFYERQFARSHYTGSIGIVGHVNYIQLKGKGVFSRTGEISDDTLFTFHALPISLGASYRFVQLRYLVPYAQLSLMGIPYMETRNDDKPSHRGVGRGFSAHFGLNFNVDWIYRKNTWDRYDAYGVLHTYLTAQAEFIRTVGGPVKFNYDGVYGGLTVEF